MKDEGKTKDQLISELLELRQRVGALEEIEAERKRAEEALREAEKRYRDLYDSAPVMYHTIDTKGIVLDCNQTEADMLGYTKEEIIGQPIYAFQTKEYQDLAPHALRDGVEKGYAVGERRFVKKDGNFIDIVFSAKAFYDDSGQLGGFRTTGTDITERKHAEEEITRLAKFPSENPNPVLRVAKDGTLLYSNKAALPLLDVWGCQAGQLLPDDWRKFTLDTLSSGFGKEAEVELEDRILSLTFAPVVNADYVNVYGLDITERKHAEEEISHRAKQLALINEVGQKIAPVLELNELYQTVVEAVQEKFGYQNVALFSVREDEVALEAVAGPQATLMPSEGYTQKIGQGLVGWVAQSGETLLANDVTKEPRFLHLEFLEIAAELDVPIRLGGKTIGVLLVDSDRPNVFTEADVTTLETIADQVSRAIENAGLYEQTDENLRRTVAELAALYAIAESLTTSLELDEMMESVVTRVAQVMEARICTIRLVEGDELTIGAAVGYRDESARQHRIKIDARLARTVRDQKPLLVEDLWKSEDIPPSRRDRAKREGVRSFLGVPMICRGETIGVLSIYGEEPHRFTQEEISLLITIANQTAVAIERVRLHERVREHAEELERLVQERTKQFQATYVELLQSAKLAALGQLAAGVAHELNNPLGAISGYLELLQEEVELGPREMEYVERIEKRIQQATKIVAELRSVGIPSEPVWRIVYVNDILEETIALVERRLSLHQIKVQRDITPDLPLMHADPDRLQQVFINMITNARQAMEEGGTLRVTSGESRNGEWLEIIFADTGKGIAKHHLDKIFDPFFTTRGPGKGMGLGLSLSHRHIRDHGGAVDVWSEKGRGTVFRVVLPPSEAKRCWEMLDCDEKERCKAVRENAEYRCWSVMEDVSRCERCEVYRRKALPPLDGRLLPQ